MLLSNNRDRQVDADIKCYVFRYYPQLMNAQERAANLHLFGTVKATNGRSDAAAQTEARSGPRHLHDLLSDEPQVLRLAADGYQAFVMRTAEGIIREHSDKIELNCCPQCGRVARTPRARQCRFCGNDWHGEPAISK
jgi:hypothetical protein